MAVLAAWPSFAMMIQNSSVAASLDGTDSKLISDRLIREECFESGFRESEARGLVRLRQRASGLLENERLGERVDNMECVPP